MENHELFDRIALFTYGVNWSAQTRECFVGWNDQAPFILWAIHEAVLDLLETWNYLLYSYSSTKHHDFPLKYSHFESPQFSSSPTVTSLVLFPTIYRQLSRPLYDNEGQKVALFTFIISAILSPIDLKLQNVFIWYLINT